MKNKQKLLAITSSSVLLLLPVSTTISCNVPHPESVPPQDSNNNNSNNSNSQLDPIELMFDDYFVDWDQVNEKNLKKEVKNKITKTIKDYHLDEWNNYYQKEGLSKVFDIKLSEYSQMLENDNGGYKDFKWNKLTDKNKNIATSIYNKQDPQFQLLNDSINIMNNEDEENHEDFLYLRWKYYSIFGAELYNTRFGGLPISTEEIPESDFVEPEKIKDISVTHWMDAITDAILIPGHIGELINIIYSFMVYYGLSFNVTQMTDYFTDIKEKLSNPGKIVENLANGFKDFADNQLDFLEDLTGGDLAGAFKDLFKKLNKKFGNELSWSIFFKEFSTIVSMDECKEIIDESKDFINLVTAWGNGEFNKPGEIIGNFIDTMKDALPQIEPPSFIQDMNFDGLQNSVLHAKLCARDMLMRLINKKDTRDSYQHIWEAKRKRAFEIYEKMCEYANLFFDSLNPSEITVEKIVKVFNMKIKKFFPIDVESKILKIVNKAIQTILTPMVETVLKAIFEQISSTIYSLFNSLFEQIFGNLVYIKYNKYTNK